MEEGNWKRENLIKLRKVPRKQLPPKHITHTPLPYTQILNKKVRWEQLIEDSDDPTCDS